MFHYILIFTPYHILLLFFYILRYFGILGPGDCDQSLLGDTFTVIKFIVLYL